MRATIQEKCKKKLAYLMKVKFMQGYLYENQGSGNDCFVSSESLPVTSGCMYPNLKIITSIFICA